MTPVDLILWRAMVVTAQRRGAHEQQPTSWQAGHARLTRLARRFVEMAVTTVGSQAGSRRDPGSADNQ
jgi:hypothetical protein